jgi:hypothetical protein
VIIVRRTALLFSTLEGTSSPEMSTTFQVLGENDFFVREYVAQGVEQSEEASETRSGFKTV